MKAKAEAGAAFACKAHLSANWSKYRACFQQLPHFQLTIPDAEFTSELLGDTLGEAMEKLTGSAIVLAFGLLVSAQNAQAQSAPVNWSGFAVGASVGGSFGATTGQNVILTAPVFFGRPDPSGIMGGLGASYNYQIDNGFVLGVVGDFSLLDASDTLKHDPKAHPFFIPNWSLRVRNDWFATLRARVGYATGPMLFYATGGLALTQSSASFDLIPATGTPATITTIQPGWTLGAGIDYAIAPHWSLEAEYLYARINKISFSVVPPATPGSTASFAENMNIARLGLNYRF